MSNYRIVEEREGEITDFFVQKSHWLYGWVYDCWYDELGGKSRNYYKTIEEAKERIKELTTPKPKKETIIHNV